MLDVKEAEKMEIKEVQHTGRYTLHDNVNHPAYYEREDAIECIDEMEMVFGVEDTMSYCKLRAWALRYRATANNGQEDIKKSDCYMRKYKELKEKKYPRYSVYREHNY